MLYLTTPGELRKGGVPVETIATFGQRLRQLMAERSLSYEELGRLLDMRPQTLNRYVLGQREPRASVATDIALALQVDPLWLQGYDVPRSRASSLSPIQPEREVLLPILGVIRAGIPTLAQQEVLGHASADVSEPERYFYLRVMGDSMSGAGIHDGDLVLIRQQDWADSGQIIACVVGGEDATLKRFHRQGDTVILQPENPAYQPRLVPVSDFDCGRARIVGVAVRLVREL